MYVSYVSLSVTKSHVYIGRIVYHSSIVIDAKLISGCCSSHIIVQRHNSTISLDLKVRFATPSSQQFSLMITKSIFFTGSLIAILLTAWNQILQSKDG